MDLWLINLIDRWSRGERFRRATPRDYRLWSAVFFVLPAASFAFVKFKGLFDASMLVVWVALTVFGLVVSLAVFACSRFFPALISLALATIAWIALFRSLA